MGRLLDEQLDAETEASFPPEIKMNLVSRLFLDPMYCRLDHMYTWHSSIHTDT